MAFGEQKAVDPKIKDELKNLLGALKNSSSSSSSTNKPHDVAPIKPSHKEKDHQSTKTSKPKAPVPKTRDLKLETTTEPSNIPPTREWWTLAPPLPSRDGPLTESHLASFTKTASNLLPKAPVSSKETEFMSQMISSGTLSDRLSALTLMVQSSPFHNTRSLETLKGMAERGKGSGGREESLKALRCIVDWWVGGGCPDRKLKYFRDQPSLGHPDATDIHLVVWYFEDWLKKFFYSILQILETLVHDNLAYVRTQTYTLLFTLLRSRPEQEQNLLRLGVTGLADNTRPIPSKTTTHLIDTLQLHPGMKMVVITEICENILKISSPPAAGLATQNKHIRFDDAPKPKAEVKKAPATLNKGTLAALQTLAQLVLSSVNERERAVARKLIKVYFEMFSILLPSSASSASGDGEDVGVGAEGEGEVKKDRKGRVLEKKTKRSKKDKDDDLLADDRSKIMSTILTGVNRAIPFAFDDKSEWNELLPLTTPLFHLSASPSVTFNVSLQAMTLLQRVVETLSSSSEAAKNVKKRYYRSLHQLLLDGDGRLGASGKEVMFLNLVLRSMKEDLERLCALLHRLVQLLVTGSKSANPEFVEGGLVLIDQLFSTFPTLRTFLFSSRSKEPSSSTYDPSKREPEFANASSSPLWELTPLLHHYHPTISLHASQLLSGSPLSGASTDMGLNTVSHFLDRFVFKNPKKIKGGQEQEVEGKRKGGSYMQPAFSESGERLRRVKGEQSAMLAEKWDGEGEEYLRIWEEGRKRRGKKAGRAESGEEEGEEGEDEDEGEESMDEDEIWKVYDVDIDDDEDGLSGLEAGDDSENESIDLDDADLLSQAPSDEGDEDDAETSDGSQEAELSNPNDSDDEDGFASDSDASDLMPFDGLIDFPDDEAVADDLENVEAEEEEWGGISGNDKKRKRKDAEKDDNGGKKKRKKAALPTFASYEDYQKMIEEGPEDFI
ncbi:ribosome biogenesis protein [Flagelloscypha sp. PMI_526]|nr:ribosome biogenesis protein [Flagelloscypha sp. PMI_526]